MKHDPSNIAGRGLAILGAVLVLTLLNVHVAPADLIGYWPLDEQSGDAVPDLSGNGFDGVVEGSPAWTDGKYAGGLEFFGDGDHVEIADDPLLRFDTDANFTAMAWIFVPEDAGANCAG